MRVHYGKQTCFLYFGLMVLFFSNFVCVLWQLSECISNLSLLVFVERMCVFTSSWPSEIKIQNNLLCFYYFIMIVGFREVNSYYNFNTGTYHQKSSSTKKEWSRLVHVYYGHRRKSRGGCGGYIPPIFDKGGWSIVLSPPMFWLCV